MPPATLWCFCFLQKKLVLLLLPAAHYWYFLRQQITVSFGSTMLLPPALPCLKVEAPCLLLLAGKPSLLFLLVAPRTVESGTVSTQAFSSENLQQHALSTKAGCECPIKTPKLLGIGGYDLNLLTSCVGGPSKDGERRQDPPLCEDVLWQPSTYSWEDTGTTQDIPQGEGSKATPSCHSLFALGLNRASPRSAEGCCRGVRFH